MFENLASLTDERFALGQVPQTQSLAVRAAVLDACRAQQQHKARPLTRHGSHRLAESRLNRHKSRKGQAPSEAGRSVIRFRKVRFALHPSS